MDFEALQRASKRENLLEPETFDPIRLRRAQLFATKIMYVIGRFCPDKAGARDALTAAAYGVDAEIVSRADDT